MKSTILVRSLTTASLALALLSCGGDKVSDSTPPETLPPAPAETVTTPPAAGTPLPGMSCNLPAVSRASDDCRREGDGVFVPQVDAAINKLMAQQPNIFDGLLIVDLPRFRVGLLKNLEAAGLCAAWDEDRSGHREMMVKNSNAFSEQYHVELSNGNVRMGIGAYRSTCYPANFPVNPQPLAPRGDCALPSSRDYGCDRLVAGGQFTGMMDEIASAIGRERTDLVRDGYVVGNVNDYYNEMIKRLRARGYCAFFDGHDIAVKNSNDFNEQFHVVYSWGQLRTGSSSYRATCRPAAF